MVTIGDVMNIRDKLKKMRNELEMTQQEVADKLEVSQVTYSRYEAGSRVPDRDMTIVLAKFFNCTTDYLLGLTAEPNLVHYDTGVDYEGDRVYIEIVKEALDKGLTKDDIEEFIQMGLLWREQREKTKKPKID